MEYFLNQISSHFAIVNFEWLKYYHIWYVGMSGGGFPTLKEEAEESEDDQQSPSDYHDQDDQSNMNHNQSNMNYDQGVIASPNFNSPTFDLSIDQGNQDLESQQNVDHNMLDQADDITVDAADLVPVASPQGHNFRNIRRTILEISVGQCQEL